MISEHDKQMLNSANIIHTLRKVNVSSFYDNWGPEEVIHVYHPEQNLQAILVIDNTIGGPSLGNLTFQPYITPFDAFVRAREMTWQTSFFNLPFGGASALIRGKENSSVDPSSFLQFVERISSFIPSKFIMTTPDNINHKDLELIINRFGDLKGLVGKPEQYGGIPKKLGAKAVGIGSIIETEFAMRSNSGPENIIRIAIEGDAKLGINLIKYINNDLVSLIALEIPEGIIFDNDGIDIEDIDDILDIHSSLPKTIAKIHQNRDIVSIDCDILVLTSNNLSSSDINKITASIIVEATERPIPRHIIKLLKNNGTTIIPSIIANSGDLIAASYEFRGLSKEEAFSEVHSLVSSKYREVQRLSKDTGLNIREQAIEVARNLLHEKLDQTR